MFDITKPDNEQYLNERIRESDRERILRDVDLAIQAKNRLESNPNPGDVDKDGNTNSASINIITQHIASLWIILKYTED